MKYLKTYSLFEQIEIPKRDDLSDLFLNVLKPHIACPNIFEYDPWLYYLCFLDDNLVTDDNDFELSVIDPTNKYNIDFVKKMDPSILKPYYDMNKKLSDEHIDNYCEELNVRVEYEPPFSVYFSSWWIREYYSENNKDQRSLNYNKGQYSRKNLIAEGFNKLQIDVLYYFKNGVPPKITWIDIK